MLEERKGAKVHFVVKECNDTFLTWSYPGCVSLERGMACQFEVFATQLCTAEIKDSILLVIQENSSGPFIVTISVNVEIELTTKFHYEDDECEKHICEGSAGFVFNW